MSFEQAAENLEKYPEPQKLRIKKFVVYACWSQWINDAKVLEQFALQDLLQQLCHLYPTLESLETGLSELTATVSKQEIYQRIAQLLLAEMATLYVSGQQTRPIFSSSAVSSASQGSVKSIPLQPPKSVILDFEKIVSSATGLTRVKVTLEVAEDDNNTQARLVASLPYISEVEQFYHTWSKHHRSLGSNFRLGASIQQGDISTPEQLFQSQKAAHLLQNHLASWYSCSEFRRIRERLIGELRLTSESRLVVRTHSSGLGQIPWYLFFDDFLDTYRQVEVVVSLPEYEQIKVLPTAKPRVRILAILGNSEGIDVEADERLLKALPNAEVLFLVEPARSRLNDVLWDESWDILFFAGHSSSQGEEGRFYINQTDSLSIAELKYALTEAISKGLQLAIFNSCDGSGLAKELASLHLPHTVVMREPVPDRVAQEFLKYFLKAFSGGKSVYLALREARERLQPFETHFPGVTWLPVLFYNPTAKSLTWNQLYQALPPQAVQTVEPQKTESPTPTANPSQPALPQKTEQNHSWQFIISCFKFYLKLYWILLILFFLGHLSLPQLLMLWGVLIFGCIEAVVTAEQENANLRGTKLALNSINESLRKQVEQLKSGSTSKLQRKVKRYGNARTQINRAFPKSSNPSNFAYQFIEYKAEMDATLKKGYKKSEDLFNQKKAQQLRLKKLEQQKRDQRAKYWDKE